jgi:hypothetical protein
MEEYCKIDLAWDQDGNLKGGATGGFDLRTSVLGSFEPGQCVITRDESGKLTASAPLTTPAQRRSVLTMLATALGELAETITPENEPGRKLVLAMLGQTAMMMAKMIPDGPRLIVPSQADVALVNQR